MQITTTDGQAIDIHFLVKPRSISMRKKYPLVVSIYGAPGAQSVYNEFGASAWEQYLAQQGYVVVSVNNRGSGRYGQKFSEVVCEKLEVYESSDFTANAKYLTGKFPWIDNTRTAIQGHSYGGFTSVLCPCYPPGVFPGTYRCGAGN
ncbi:MAG: prolyl oligopeptidase family serine peptidase [Saprospiraceae bacterium]|nr:prolyl oligopeptidase family serine peptidase [Saprospiraceae bacterium]